MSGTRTLTVLFTDMVGSTELFSGLDEHESERLLSSHLQALQQQIERFGGTVVKTLGDGVMATFPAARNALDCATSMQAVCSLPPARGARHVPIRVGMSSGDLRTDGEDCFGTAVVEANRLCSVAAPEQILASETTRLVAGDHRPLRLVGELELKGLPEPVRAWQAEWSAETLVPLRVVLADDAPLVREGVARLLEEAGIEVVGQAGDAEELIREAAELHPDVAIVDVRMPPTHTVEGLEAAERLRREHSGMAVLVLSQDLQLHYARRLLAASPNRVGYLVKERVSNVSEFAAAVRRVAAGGTAFEDEVICSINSVHPRRCDTTPTSASTHLGSVL